MRERANVSMRERAQHERELRIRERARGMREHERELRMRERAKHERELYA